MHGYYTVTIDSCKRFAKRRLHFRFLNSKDLETASFGWATTE